MKLNIYFLKIQPPRVETPQKDTTGRSVFLSGFLLCGGSSIGGI